MMLGLKRYVCVLIYICVRLLYRYVRRIYIADMSVRVFMCIWCSGYKGTYVSLYIYAWDSFIDTYVVSILQIVRVCTCVCVRVCVQRYVCAFVCICETPLQIRTSYLYYICKFAIYCRYVCPTCSEVSVCVFMCIWCSD